MSIHSHRYQRYDGVLESPRTRFWPIAEAELRRIAKEKWARRLMVLAWMPALYQAVMLYAKLVVKKAVGIDLGAFGIYQNLLQAELGFVAVILAAFGAGLISRDIETKALTLYFTRPVDAAQYHMGKFIAAASLVLLVTFVPGVLLGIAQAVMGEVFEVGPFLDGLGRLTLASAGMAFTSASLILLLSSSGWSSRYVGATWLGLFTLLEIARSALSSVFGRSPLLDIMSLGRLFTGSVDFLFAGQTDQLPAVIALWGFGVFFAVCLRVRISTLERVRS